MFYYENLLELSCFLMVSYDLRGEQNHMDIPSMKEKIVHSTFWVPYSYYWNIISKNSPYCSTPPHWHPEFEINYIVQGGLEFRSGTQAIIAAAGDILITQPNTLHSIYSLKNEQPDSRYHTLVFNPSLLCCTREERPYAALLGPIFNGNVTLASIITNAHPYYEEISTSMNNIVSCAKAGTPLLDLLMKSELLRLFYLILQYEGSAVQLPISKAHMDMQPVLDYVADHYSEPIRLQQLADIAYLSCSHFMTQFKQSIGVSAMTYVNQIRVQHVCKMLTETDLSILNIAGSCGFRNLSNFDQQFRKLVGCSPSQYRAQAKQSQSQT